MAENKFPITSLSELLVPEALLKLKVIEGNSVSELSELANKWVDDEANIIVAISPVTQVTYGDKNSFVVALTYLPATE